MLSPHFSVRFSPICFHYCWLGAATTQCKERSVDSVTRGQLGSLSAKSCDCDAPLVCIKHTLVKRQFANRSKNLAKMCQEPQRAGVSNEPPPPRQWSKEEIAFTVFMAVMAVLIFTGRLL